METYPQLKRVARSTRIYSVVVNINLRIIGYYRLLYLHHSFPDAEIESIGIFVSLSFKIGFVLCAELECSSETAGVLL